MHYRRLAASATGVLKTCTLTALLQASTGFAARCDAEREIDRQISITGISALRVNVLAGYLSILPTDNSEVRFLGTACTDSEQWLDDMQVDVGVEGSVLEITVIIPYDDRDFDAEYAYMDVDLSLPPGLSTGIRDSSGDISIEDVSITRLDDSSGDIRIRRNHTGLVITDSSGSMELRDIGGDLEITDSSGDIDIRQVQGSVHIPRDSSGRIDIEAVRGRVVIGRDGSGDIEVEDIMSSVTVGSDGSGDIRIHHVGSDVTIGGDGSGLLSISDIAGNLLIEGKGSGDIRTRRIEGSVSLPR